MSFLRGSPPIRLVTNFPNFYFLTLRIKNKV